MNVHFSGDLGEDDASLLFNYLPVGSELTSGNMDGTPDRRSTIEVLIDGRPSPELLDSCPQLHSVVVPWVGPPKATVDLVRQRPHIRLYNIHHNAVPVAEMALGLLFSTARLIPLRDRLLRRGDWLGGYHLPTTILRGKTALLLGYGAIARQLHPVLQALGMDVVAISRRGGTESWHKTAAELRDTLAICDVLISTLPLTEETNGMMGPDELTSMKPSALIVNVGRARVFDQEALFTSLSEGQIAAAGLDVWYRYPQGEGRGGETLPGEYPFWELDNVVMTPHMAGEWPNPEVNTMRLEHLGNLLAQLAKGTGPEPMDVARGY